MNRKRTKFFHTEIKMQKAFIKLLEEKDFCDIEISELCTAANINRSTFYAHFDNMDDLLQNTKNEIFKVYSDSFIDKVFDGNTDNFFVFTPQYIMPFLEFVQNNKTILKVCLKNAKTFDLPSIYSEKLGTVYARIFNEYGITDSATISYMSAYFLSGFFAIIKLWLNNDCKDDMSFICSLIENCATTAQAAQRFQTNQPL